MIKVFISCILLSLVLLAGCSNVDKDHVKPPKDLFSDEKDHYSLLIIRGKNTDEIDLFDWKNKNNIRNVDGFTAVQETSLKKAEKEFEYLELEELPTFVAFDTKGIAFQTNNKEKLINFLQSKVPGSWNH
ncbi:hypothetical protein [Virgibacillus ihumii]|uniref:hypothetical protein n=1 Tax=Virgibacillus ihumii TaxID=2686091 RepID=UPI00157E1FA7|nr:hypothetical protein [Virgibacillus ihumii]